MKPHWYRIYLGECPVCGRHQGYRERVYGLRPEMWEDRHVWLPAVETYDNCG